MASKKAVKRKTVWRTLSIGAEEAAAAAAAADKAGTSALMTAPLTSSATISTASCNGSDGVEQSASGARNACNSTGSNNNGGNPHQQNLRTTSHNHQYDGRSKPFAPYNRHHSSSSTAFHHSNSKFTRRPSAYAANGPESRPVNTDTTPTAVNTPPSGETSLAASNATTTCPASQRWAGQRSSAGRSDRFAGRSANGGVGASVGGATTTSAYRRRPFNPRFYNGNTRSTFRIHRQEAAGEQQQADAVDAGDAEKNATKPLFNEDDYTRITTPRQDVLFKKGYLSRPKPYAATAQQDAAGNGMEDVLVLTPEEAIAAGLMHGYDPENPYIGFYDATGMFYVNPYMNNGGVDPYTGQMMVMPPYGTDPYMTDGTQLPSDVIPQQFIGEICADDVHAVSTIEEIPADNPTDETALVVAVDETVASGEYDEVPCGEYAGVDESLPISSPEQSQDGDEPISTDESQGGATSKGNEGDGEETTPDVTIDGSATDAPTTSMPACFPQIFYPYVFGAPAPYVPVNDIDGAANYVHPYESGQSKFNRFRRRKRKPFRYPSSTGTTTTDYSEDDEHHEHHNNTTAENTFHTDASIDEVLLRTNLHADCSEFVPREFTAEEFLAPSTPPPSPTPSLVRNTTLNVHVPEFRPRAIATTAITCYHNGADVAGESDDSGVSTTEVQPSAPITPEPPTSALIDDAQFPSIGVAVSDHLDASVTEAPAPAWSYAAIAQRPPAVAEPSTVKTEQPIVASTAAATGKASAAPAKPTRKALRNTANVAPEAGSAKPNSKPRQKGLKSSPKKQNATNEPTKVTETAQSDATVLKPVAELIETNKSAQLSFADLLRPTVTEPIVVMNVKSVEQRTGNTTADAKPHKPLISVKADTIPQSLDATIPRPVLAVANAPTWQTIRVNGKKRLVQHVESVDFWEEQEPEPVVPVVQVEKKIVSIETVEDQTLNNDHDAQNDDDAEVVEPVKTKTKKPKSKKSAVKKNSVKDHKSQTNAQANDLEDKCTPVEIEPLPTDDLTDDLTEYNFVTDPNAIFVNAIAPAAATLFSSPRGDKFGCGGLFAANTFDFVLKSSPQSTNATLRQEEDMVMRIMRSISSVEAATKSANVDFIGKTNEIEVIVADAAPENVFEEDSSCALKEEEIEEKSVKNGGVKLLKETTQHVMKKTPIDEEETKLRSNGHSEPVLSNGLSPKSNGHSEHHQLKNDDEHSVPLSNGCHHPQSIDSVPPMESTKRDEQPPNELTSDAAATAATPTTIGISSISHNGNTHGNTIESVHTDAIIVTNPLQITLDVSPDCIVGAAGELSDDASTLSSLDDSTGEDEEEEDDDDDDDSEADDRTVVEGPLDEYIEDVMMIDGSSISSGDDADNLLGCGEFYVQTSTTAAGEGCCDPLCDGDIDELIKHAEQIVRATTTTTLHTTGGNEVNDEDDDGGLLLVNGWTKTADHDDDALHPDRNESPRSSEDSGILDNHDEAIASSNESEEATDEQLEEPATLKCSLTEAVSRWLVEKQKEKSPEPIIRLPDDPALSTQIEKSIQRFQISEMLKSYAVDEADYDDDEDDVFDENDDDENYDVGVPLKDAETTASKNLQSNPLAASSANGDATDKRVAAPHLTTTGATTARASPLVSLADEPDILEYWDVDPMLTQQQQLERRRRCAAQEDGTKSPVNYAQLLSEVGTRTTIDFLMSQQKQQQQLKEAATTTKLAATQEAATSPLQQRIDAKSGEYLKRHQFGCALM